MQFITNLYTNIINSIYNPEFYGNLKHQKTSFTVYYALQLSFLLALLVSIFTIGTIYYYIGVGGEGKLKFYNYTREYLNSNFADDLVLNFKDGILSSNKKDPIIFPIPEDIKDEIEDNNLSAELNKMKELTNFVVIDTSNDFDISLFKNYNTFAFFAKDSGAIYNDKKAQLQMLDYSEVNNEDFTKEFPEGIMLNKSSMNKYFEMGYAMFNSFLPYLYVFGFVFMLIAMFIFIFLGMFVFAIVTGLIILLFAKLMGKEGTFGEWYLKAIHADTLPLIISWVTIPVFYLFSIPFSYTVLVLIILYFNNFVENKN